jgi:hypothetical protein
VLSKSGSCVVKIGPSRTHPNAAAKIEARGASPLMRERRSNEPIMPHTPPAWQEKKQEAVSRWPVAVRESGRKIQKNL